MPKPVSLTKVLAFLGLTACLIASPALAGPAGTGLTFTEEVAKKRAAASATPQVQQTSAPKESAPEPRRAS
jgi:hypothetical protein